MKIARFSIFIFILIFLTRGAYFLQVNSHPPQTPGFGSMWEMERAAVSLAKEGTIANIYSADSGVSAHVAPLYPGFLSVLYRLSGSDLARFRWAEGISAIVSTALCAALMPTLASRARLSKGVGKGAALLMLLSPLGMGIEIRGDWEATFVPLALMAALWFLMALQDSSWRDRRLAAVGGLVVGLGALLSPVVLLGVFLALFGQALACRGRAQVAQLALSGSILFGAAGLTIAPWVYRNYMCFRAFVPIRSNFGIEFAVGNNPENHDGTTYGGSRIHPSLNDVEREKLKALGEVAYNRLKLDETTAWIMAHPAKFAELTARRLVSFWFPIGDAAWGPKTLVPIWVKSAALGVVTLLAFGGLGWLFVVRHPYRLLIAGIFFGPSLPYIISHVFIRYRYPLLWLTFLLACECVARVRTAARRVALDRVNTGLSNDKSSSPG
jgi:hypothetical protein